MRQFDIFAWGGRTEPTFTDPDLGWFFTEDFNARLNESDAEWIVFAHASVVIDRDFLNSLAENISGFPMVDAFAPRIHTGTNGEFLSGFKLSSKEGVAMLESDAKLRYVAAPHPYLAAFSRRIVQRTGAFDPKLPPCMQILDYSLRMLHAGGKMFSVPYLVTTAAGEIPDNPYGGSDYCGELAATLVKSFGYWYSARFILRHPKAIAYLRNNRTGLKEKRQKAILLSKLKESFLKDLA